MPPSSRMSKQEEILCAIKTLSDRMDAAGIVTTTTMETRLDAQDKLTSLEAEGRINPITARLDSIDTSVRGIKDEVKGVKDQLTILNGTVRRHDTELVVINTFCEDQVQPALIKLTDLRIEFSKWAVGGAGLGTILLLGISIFRALGWM